MTARQRRAVRRRQRQLWDRELVLDYGNGERMRRYQRERRFRAALREAFLACPRSDFEDFATLNGDTD